MIRAPLFLQLCCTSDGGHDARIRSTAADVAVHPLDDLLLRRMRMLAQQRRGGKDHARRAVPTLKRFFIQECLLNGTERAMALEPFDGGDLCPCDGRGYGQAGPAGSPINQHRTGAALSLAATVLCSC